MMKRVFYKFEESAIEGADKGVWLTINTERSIRTVEGEKVYRCDEHNTWVNPKYFVDVTEAKDRKSVV